VVSSIVPANNVESANQLAIALKTTRKLHAFDRYCAAEPEIIGIIEKQEKVIKEAKG